MAWSQASEPGDTDPLISDAKKHLNRFSYGKGLGVSDEYTVEFGVALQQWQNNVHTDVLFKRREGPDVVPNGVFSWATKKQMRILPEDKIVPAKKIVFTVAGHLGAWDTGPAYICGKWMADQGLTRVQGIGYNNVDIPFRSQTGVVELMRLIHDPVTLPHGTEWAIAAHSQGAIVAAYVMETIMANRDQWPYSHFKGGVQFGNPRRPKGVVAPWVADPPDKDSEGLAHNCLEAAIPGVAEVSRKKDLYADKKPGPAGEYKTAVYRIVAESTFLGNDDSLGEQMAELIKSGGKKLWDVFVAITSGIGFAVNMDPHNIFDLGPCIDHLRRILAV